MRSDYHSYRKKAPPRVPCNQLGEAIEQSAKESGARFTPAKWWA
jgi:hypothetical protein